MQQEADILLKKKKKNLSIWGIGEHPCFLYFYMDCFKLKLYYYLSEWSASLNKPNQTPLCFSTNFQKTGSLLCISDLRNGWPIALDSGKNFKFLEMKESTTYRISLVSVKFRIFIEPMVIRWIMTQRKNKILKYVV